MLLRIDSLSILNNIAFNIVQSWTVYDLPLFTVYTEVATMSGYMFMHIIACELQWHIIAN